MSYWCRIGFKEVSSSDELLNEIQKMKNDMQKRAKEIVSKNLTFCYDYARTGDTAARRFAIEVWLQRLLRIRLLYWADFHLLGYCSEGEFEGFEFIEFQNSCDQDYEFESYPTQIAYFQNKIKEYKELSPKEVAERIRNFCDLDEDDEDQNEYTRRWALYLTIEKELGICRFLREESSSTGDTPFMRFNIAAIDDYELLRLTSSVLTKLDRN